MAKPKQGLTVERADLLAALTTVTKAVESRNTYPILANVYLAAADDRLTVRGSDLDIEITTGIPAKGALSPITAPAKTLLDIVRKLPPGAEVQIEPDGALLIVKAGRSRFKLATFSAESFPTIDAAEFGKAFDVDLCALFAPVAFAISNEAARYYLNGIFLHADGAMLTAVATDGHRLARHRMSSDQEFKGIIVPKKTVGLIPGGAIAVEVSDSKIRMTQGETVIVSKLIEGTFPDYERVIPKNNDKELVVDRAATLSALERVSVVVDPKTGNAVKLDLAADALTLSVSGQGNAAAEELAVEYASEPFAMGFNAQYLADELRSVSGEKVHIVMGDALGPALVHAGNDNWTGVIMPTRVA